MSRMPTKRTSLFGWHPLRLGPVTRAPGRPTRSLGPSLIILTIRSGPAFLILASASLRKSRIAKPRWFSPSGASAGGTC